MQSKDINFEISSLQKKMDELITTINEVKSLVRPDNELWDSYDVIDNLKISPRTLADWRAKRLIGFVKVGSKIWYPKESIEEFMGKNYNLPRNNEREI